MIPWNKRPTISANLLNPAFCGEVVRRCILAFQNEHAQVSFPYPLMFLVLPLVLHKETRAALPKTTRKSFFEWVSENQHLKVNFGERARSLVPYTQEAFLFLLQHQSIEILHNGNLSVRPYRKKNLLDENKEEVEEIFRKAAFLGKWLSISGDTKTIFTVLGVKP